MTQNKPCETPIPMVSQCISTSFGSLNDGYPTVEPNLSQSIFEQNMHRVAPPIPTRVHPQNVQISNEIFGGGYGYAPQLGGYFTSPYYGGACSYFGPTRSLPTSNFAQLAVEDSRNAFQSIESVVQTFRSISLMLESTFTSVYSSFRAVTDVFDHFTRLRSQLTTIYPLIILWRFIKFLFNRILKLFRLNFSSASSSVDMNESWSKIYDSLNNVHQTNRSPPTSSSGVLVALFFIVTFGTPMLMLHFLNSMIRKRQGSDEWMQKEKNLLRVVALYDYTARNTDELSFKQGTFLSLAPSATVDRISSGLIPVNYIQIVNPNTFLPRPSSIVNTNSLTLHPQQPILIDNRQMHSSIPATTMIANMNSDILNQQKPSLLIQDSMNVENVP
ncbi:unnamed protein product [Didymodactylos carnosus]|uniref:Peroxisomal membrane protein PEX13 n=1 Tax=Didymodactylos carnosus TaxID=1234261 RepID=A0A8S2HXL9_9BILA|nr:unnamed protein product [Didymodactylos carnosus]CAF3671470.1 unnamed protein product [Didymodactylos carnosus]